MSNATDGHVEQVVKARWQAIGLSQTDLAEVLGAALQPKDGNGSNGTEASRLMQVAEALDIPFDFLRSQQVRTEPKETKVSSDQSPRPSQVLLELRLLRAFHELQDYQTKQMLVHLAEQIVKRQADRCGDAG